MTKKEREERIRQIEKQLFILNMKDNWTTADFQKDNELNRELRELKNAWQIKDNNKNKNNRKKRKKKMFTTTLIAL